MKTLQAIYPGVKMHFLPSLWKPQKKKTKTSQTKNSHFTYVSSMLINISNKLSEGAFYSAYI